MGFGHVVSELAAKIYKLTDGFKHRECALQIQGTGDETRSYCFIDDLIDAIYLVGMNGVPGEIYNIGIEDEITIKELVGRMSDALGIDIVVIPGEMRAGSPSRRCPDMKKTHALGFAPKTKMHDGLVQTFKWVANEV